MTERINKLQPDRTVHLRGFDSFAAAATIHDATPTGFQVSGIFRDPADFAVAVLYDADNFFEHPLIKYLPDFDFSGLTLNFSLNYTDSVQPLDSPKFPWIDWASLDIVRPDGTTTKVSLWENAMLADASFPAASATVNVVAGTSTIQPGDRLTLWYENLFFDYTVPGGLNGSATFFAQDPGSHADLIVGANTYRYTVPLTSPQEDGPTIARNVAGAAAADPLVQFTVSGNVVHFSSKVNTGATVNVSGYNQWLITDPPDVFIAKNVAAQINGCDWATANTIHGLLAGTSGSNAITITAARYGTVNVTGTSITWTGGTKFSGITPGSPFVIAGASYTVAGIQDQTHLTLNATPSAPTAANAPYLALRGGRDGNMIELYTLATSPTTLTFDSAQIQLTGGRSDVTWNISIQFSAAANLNLIRQCWLTFAPSLANGAAFSEATWQATFSNWALTESAGADNARLQVAGPGSVRIEESDSACAFTANWSVQSGFYSNYFAQVASAVNESVTVTYACQYAHDLYLGTSLNGGSAAPTSAQLIQDPLYVLVENTLYNPSINGTFYSDRGIAGFRLDGDTETFLDCRVNTSGSELVTRRLLRSSVAAGTHTVVIRVQQAGFLYFDFLEAAVLSNVPAALPPRTNVSPALDFDTDHTYKLPPARLMWIMDKLGYAGPMNEYLGVFWWNERIASGGSHSTAVVTFPGPFAVNEKITLYFSAGNGTPLQKTIFSADTAETIATHFAAYINGSLVGAWASATAGVLTVTARSPAPAYNLVLSSPDTGKVSVTPETQTPGDYPSWIVNDDPAVLPINPAVRDWHADFYAQCAARGREVVTACSMELVNPPDGYVARFHDHNPVATNTDFGGLISNHCAVGSSKLLGYQKRVYRNIAQMQAAAGLTPSVQYGEFLWWYTAEPAPGVGGMAYYDDETKAAALTALGRELHVFTTTNDDPSVSGSTADAVFLRNRLRDFLSALVTDLRSAYPTAKCELLWPYDVNYPTPVPESSPTTGGQLNRFVNLPVEWQQQSTSGFDTVKVEGLAFSTGMRDLDLAGDAINLFPAFGWPLSALRYLLPVFGFAVPWQRELALVWGAGIPIANFWAFDHICLYNLEVPEPGLERRSIVKNR